LLGQLGDDLLEGGEFRLQGIDSRLEPNTIGAGSRVRDTHGDRSYTLDRRETTPVNGHSKFFSDMLVECDAQDYQLDGLEERMMADAMFFETLIRRVRGE